MAVQGLYAATCHRRVPQLGSVVQGGSGHQDARVQHAGAHGHHVDLVTVSCEDRAAHLVTLTALHCEQLLLGSMQRRIQFDCSPEARFSLWQHGHGRVGLPLATVGLAPARPQPCRILSILQRPHKVSKVEMGRGSVGEGGCIRATLQRSRFIVLRDGLCISPCREGRIAPQQSAGHAGATGFFLLLVLGLPFLTRLGFATGPRGRKLGLAYGPLVDNLLRRHRTAVLLLVSAHFLGVRPAHLCASEPSVDVLQDKVQRPVATSSRQDCCRHEPRVKRCACEKSGSVLCNASEEFSVTAAVWMCFAREVPVVLLRLGHSRVPLQSQQCIGGRGARLTWVRGDPFLHVLRAHPASGGGRCLHGL
eukprot:scaffold5232_cov408-Prasinococcus_capsulatus_cf.AAC.2